MILDFFFKSLGIKRKVSALLIALIPIIEQDPSLYVLAPLVSHIAAFFGITGLSVALKEKTLLGHSTASLASVFTLLVELTNVIPVLQPYHPLILAIGSLLGFASVVVGVKPE